MAANYIALRRSPDWLNYDLDESRAFCKSVWMPENLVVDFAGRWQSTFGMDFRQFRHDVKEIALANFAECRKSRIIDIAAQNFAFADDDLIVFTDDDDWVAPNLFEVLRSYPVPPDGFLWGSLYLFKAFAAEPDTPMLGRRELLDKAFTNNYAVTGRTLNRLGHPAVSEHFWATRRLEAGDFQPQKIPHYLSCTNKHPCSTLVMKQNSDTPGFTENMRAYLSSCAGELRQIEFDDDTAWMAKPIAAYRSVLDRCLAARAMG